MFAVELPMVEKGSSVHSVQPESTDSGVDTPAGPPGTTVLLVEDDAAVPDATRCVISGFRLPEGVTGTELIQRIREMLKQDIAAAVFTGDISPAAIQELNESGCKILYKPVQTEELFRVINQMIGKQGRSESWREKKTD